MSELSPGKKQFKMYYNSDLKQAINTFHAALDWRTGPSVSLILVTCQNLVNDYLVEKLDAGTLKKGLQTTRTCMYYQLKGHERTKYSE